MGWSRWSTNHLCSRPSSRAGVGPCGCGIKGPLILGCELLVPKYREMVRSRTIERGIKNSPTEAYWCFFEFLVRWLTILSMKNYSVPSLSFSWSLSTSSFVVCVGVSFESSVRGSPSQGCLWNCRAGLFLHSLRVSMVCWSRV